VMAIESAVRQELRCDARMAATLCRRLAALAGSTPTLRDSTLTGREQEILALVDNGLSNKDIARRLNIEVATVKNHVHSVLGKLGVSTRGQAAASLHRMSQTRAPRSPFSQQTPVRTV